MAYQGIGTGSAPNDNSGDSLLTGAIKINSNFTEIYNALGNGSTISLTKSLSINAGAGLTGGGSLSTDRTLSVSVGSGITISSGSVSVDNSVIRTSGNQAITGILTATSFVKSGGTSSQFLKADGSVDSSTYITGGAIPVGGIIMWSGTIAAIPSGWALCDGTNSTPDLRTRFVVGAGSDAGPGETFNSATGATSGQYAPGQTGGSTAHQLTTAQIPAHNHPTSIDGLQVEISGSLGQAWTLGPGNRPQNSRAFSMDNTGGGAYHENRPKYYALAFIMRIS